MKKITYILALFLCVASNVYSQGTGDTTSVEKTGWLVYYLGHAIWVEASITDKVRNEEFFTNGKSYKNGIIVDHRYEAMPFKKAAQLYSIKVFAYVDTISKQTDYVLPEKLYIVPVKVKAELLPNSEPLDQTGISFKRNNSEVTMEYWFLTNYTITDIKLLRKSDKKKVGVIKKPSHPGY